MTERRTPPWPETTINELNAYQRDGKYHPYTCGRRGEHGVLLATVDGWVCPVESCGYKQKFEW